MITKENYEGYKKLYQYKKDLPCLILIFLILNILGIAGFVLINISLLTQGFTIANTLIFGFISPLIVLPSIFAAVSDYKQRLEKLSKQYIGIDCKIKIMELKELIENYENELNQISNCKNIEKETVTENNYSSLECNQMTKEELERVKVKVKTLTKKDK